jgi:hypothetical protein
MNSRDAVRHARHIIAGVLIEDIALGPKASKVWERLNAIENPADRMAVFNSMRRLTNQLEATPEPRDEPTPELETARAVERESASALLDDDDGGIPKLPDGRRSPRL